MKQSPSRSARAAMTLSSPQDFCQRQAAHIAPLLKRPKVAIVSDAHVASLHLAYAHQVIGRRKEFLIQTSHCPKAKATKSWAHLQDVVHWLLTEQIERADVVIAFGGGVIGDLVGFAAVNPAPWRAVCTNPDFASWRRSTARWAAKQASTPPTEKISSGPSTSPALVLADISVLGTLTERDFLAGYGEVAKYGLLGDAAFFDWLEANGPALAAGDEALRLAAVKHSVAMKAGIVSRDETEQGERALLNSRPYVLPCPRSRHRLFGSAACTEKVSRSAVRIGL